MCLFPFLRCNQHHNSCIILVLQIDCLQCKSNKQMSKNHLSIAYSKSYWPNKSWGNLDNGGEITSKIWSKTTGEIHVKPYFFISLSAIIHYIIWVKHRFAGCSKAKGKRNLPIFIYNVQEATFTNAASPPLFFLLFPIENKSLLLAFFIGKYFRH